MKTCHNIIAPLIAALTITLGACSDHNDPQPEPDTAEATIVITSRADNSSIDNASTPSDNELIKSWWMVFVDNQGVVQLILERPSDKTAPVAKENVELSISNGKYTIYAFANINKADFNISKGEAMPDLSGKTWTTVGQIGDNVPMTGKLENVTIDNSSNTQVEVEVVRLWAKLRFLFTTDTEKEIKVSKITMTPALNETGVTLLPDYTSLGKKPVLPDGVRRSTLELTPTDGLTVTKAHGAETTVYLLESTAESHPTGHYPLSFEYNDGSARTAHALAYQLEYINRNDFITIPVLITDWSVDATVLFYPPIGGYPAVITEKKDEEFYAKFGSAGKFVIRPTITSADGTTVTADKLSMTLSTEDTDGILNTAPAYDDTTGEIIGVIASGKTGTAVVTLTIQITTDAIKHQIVRKFYIIRQNSQNS